MVYWLCCNLVGQTPGSLPLVWNTGSGEVIAWRTWNYSRSWSPLPVSLWRYTSEWSVDKKSSWVVAATQEFALGWFSQPAWGLLLTSILFYSKGGCVSSMAAFILRVYCGPFPGRLFRKLLTWWEKQLKYKPEISVYTYRYTYTYTYTYRCVYT